MFNNLSVIFALTSSAAAGVLTTFIFNEIANLEIEPMPKKNQIKELDKKPVTVEQLKKALQILILGQMDSVKKENELNKLIIQQNSTISKLETKVVEMEGKLNLLTAENEKIKKNNIELQNNVAELQNNVLALQSSIDLQCQALSNRIAEMQGNPKTSVDNGDLEVNKFNEVRIKLFGDKLYTN